jgi:hypothetical protein
MTGMEQLPIACTLTPAAMADRAEWLRRLGALSLREGRRVDGALELRFDAAAEDEVRRWMRAEQECCAFLEFDLRCSGDLLIRVTGPPGSEPVLDGLLRQLRVNQRNRAPAESSFS